MEHWHQNIKTLGQPSKTMLGESLSKLYYLSMIEYFSATKVMKTDRNMDNRNMDIKNSVYITFLYKCMLLY